MQFLINVVAWSVEYWPAIVAAIVVIAAIAFFILLPIATKYDALKEWLKYAVTAAEQALGSGTGQVKLRYVYDWFVEKFKWFASFISFDKFSQLVDEALEWMNEQIESNSAIADLVSDDTGDDEDEEEATAEDDDNSTSESTATITEEELSEMTIAQLKEYAEDQGISLTGLRKKADIIAAILAA